MISKNHKSYTIRSASITFTTKMLEIFAFEIFLKFFKAFKIWLIFNFLWHGSTMLNAFQIVLPTSSNKQFNSTSFGTIGLEIRYKLALKLLFTTNHFQIFVLHLSRWITFLTDLCLIQAFAYSYIHIWTLKIYFDHQGVWTSRFYLDFILASSGNLSGDASAYSLLHL